MLNLIVTQLISNQVTSFLLAVGIMVVSIGSILLIATLINKRITKKEQEQAAQNSEDKK